jgi:hypothetical protein
MLTFVERIKLKTSKLVMTYRARTLDGRDYFAYILADEPEIKQMRADYDAKKPVRPDVYGEIIYQDYLKDPDEKAIAFLENWVAENDGEILG